MPMQCMYIPLAYIELTFAHITICTVYAHEHQCMYCLAIIPHYHLAHTFLYAHALQYLHEIFTCSMCFTTNHKAFTMYHCPNLSLCRQWSDTLPFSVSCLSAVALPLPLPLALPPALPPLCLPLALGAAAASDGQYRCITYITSDRYVCGYKA